MARPVAELSHDVIESKAKTNLKESEVVKIIARSLAQAWIDIQENAGLSLKIDDFGLTPHERRVLGKALYLGYFRSPPAIDAKGIALAADTKQSEVSTCLKTAQMKLAARILK
jgi:predicted DNA binding protein